MASSPAIDKLFQFVERYDLEELLEAASSSEHWKVISVEEKKHIESQGSKQKRREHLASLIAADGKRVSTFANFILRYNRAVQDAALAVLSTEPRQKESPCKFPRHFSVEQCSSQSGQKLSTCSASPMDVDTCNTELSVLDHPLKASLMADSRARLIFCGAGCSEADAVCHCEMHNYSECHTGSSRLNSVSDSLGSSSNSMDTGDPKSGLITHDLNFGPHVNFCSQDGSSSSQETQADVGYCSDLSKEVSQPGGGCASVQPLQDSLTVSRKNHRSRQKMLKHPLDNSTQYQHKKTSNFNIQINYISAQGHSIVSASDNDQIPKSCTNEWPPLLKRHCQEIMQNVNMEMLTPHLIQNELITRSEYERIAGVSPWEQSQYFVLKVLPSKGQGGFERFLKCLQEEKEHLGHQDLVQLLTKS